MMKKNTLFLGLVFIGILTFLVNLLAKMPFALNANLSALTIAILLGILFGNTFYPKFLNTPRKA